MSNIDSALEYANRFNWHVFPCIPREKRPLTPHGCKDATTDPEQIRAWWARWPDANVGIATGPASGLHVVDLDEGDGKAGCADWQRLCPAGIPTATVRTPSGGLHLYLSIPSGLVIPNRKLGKAIDTRGAGGYVLGPPSIHPGGGTYQWEIGPDGIAPMPDWLIAAIERPAGNLVNLVDPTATPGDGRPSAPDAFERCRAYLACLPDAVSGAGGHNATLEVSATCARFGLTESEHWDLLTQYNLTRCRPAWSERELRHKLKEGRKLVDREGKFGSKLDEGDSYPQNQELHGPSRPAAEEAAQNRPDAGPAADHGQPDGEGGHNQPDGGRSADGTVSPGFGGADEAVSSVEPSEEESSPPSGFPAALLNPPGVVGEICRWINDTAYKPQPVLALANSLAFWGAVVGRKVRTPTDLRSNLYCLGVAESGSGKDHSRKAVKRICQAAGVTDLLGGEEVSSDAAILAAVAAQPAILFQFDEIGAMLSQANSRHAPPHLRNVPTTFMRLFSSANTLLVGKAYGDGSRNDIDQPNPCLYGTATPDQLFNGLTKHDITQGFLNRMLAFISDDPDPEEVERPALPVPNTVISAVQAWRSRPPEPIDPRANLELPGPVVAPFDAEANAVMRGYVARCRDEKAASRDGSGYDVLWSRAVEHARKVALVLATGCDLERPRVTADLAELAVTLVHHLTTGLISAVGGSVAENDFERTCQRVERMVRAAGGKGLTRSQLTRKTQFLDARQRGAVMANLIESGRVQVQERRSGLRGPATQVYTYGNRLNFDVISAN